MSGIISPSPEGCLVGIYGYDGAQWIKIAVDANGQLLISVGTDILNNLEIIKTILDVIDNKLPSAPVADRLKVDGSGVTQPISAASLPLPAGASTESTLSSLYNMLRFKNLLLYNSLYSDIASGTASSGNIVLDLTTVPANKVLVVTACGLLLGSGSATILQFSVSDGSNIRPFMRKLSPVVNEMITCPPFVVVPPGGFLRGSATSVGSGTTATIYATGYYVAYS